MSTNANEFLPAINRIIADIEDRDAETNRMKRMVNELCGYAKIPEKYPDVAGEKSKSNSHRPTFTGDRFYNKPLATAVREFLEMRGDPNKGGLGAAADESIFEALKSGGFHFGEKDDEIALRGLRISLAKNTATFRKLPNGQFGLVDWYEQKDQGPQVIRRL